jgi:two-component SAPR family response regulator
VRVLLIDDDFSVVENLDLYLSRLFHTVEFRSWIEGQEELDSLLESFRPQGVILDFGMSPLGTEIYDWIKQWTLLKKEVLVPIVFYTSYANSPEYRKDMMDVGAREDQIIEKREVGLDISVLLRALGV